MSTIVCNDLGQPFAWYPNAVNLLGAQDIQIPYSEAATLGLITVMGTGGNIEQEGDIQGLNNLLMGGSFVGPKEVRRTFTFEASQFGGQVPGITDHLIEPDDTNWQILKVTAIGTSAAPIQYSIAIEQIWPLPSQQ